MASNSLASKIVHSLIFYIIYVNQSAFADFTRSVDDSISSTTEATSTTQTSQTDKINGTNVDWIQSVLQAYGADKGSNGNNRTYDMNTSASGHRYRVTHVNPVPSSYEDDQESDSRDHSSSPYRRSRYYHQHRDASPSNRHESNDDQDYQNSYETPKSRSYGPRDDSSSSSGTLSSREDVSRKNDPDYGQHYDSDGHRYDFGYDVKDKDGALAFRKESGNAKSLKGSYGIRDTDGRLRIVRYVADEKGFRAKVETNEPGTGSEDSANVYFNGYDADRIPSHEVVHKDRGQHSFKHGHYDKNAPADSGLYDDHREYIHEPSHEEIGSYRLHDQIPMDMGPRDRFTAVPLDANLVDTVDGSVAGIASGITGPMDAFLSRSSFKDVPNHHSTLHHHIQHPPSHFDHGQSFKYRPYYYKRRLDSKPDRFLIQHSL